jgi:hypothetical protein
MREGDDAERAHELLGSARRAAEALNLVRVRQKLERLGADRPALVEREPVAAIAAEDLIVGSNEFAAAQIPERLVEGGRFDDVGEHDRHRAVERGEGAHLAGLRQR